MCPDRGAQLAGAVDNHNNYTRRNLRFLDCPAGHMRKPKLRSPNFTHMERIKYDQPSTSTVSTTPTYPSKTSAPPPPWSVLEL